jgi:hypothetical protein
MAVPCYAKEIAATEKASRLSSLPTTRKQTDLKLKTSQQCPYVVFALEQTTCLGFHGYISYA